MRVLATIASLALASSLFAAAPKAVFVENRGQWPDEVLYRALIPGGALFVERSAFTYVLFSDSPLRHHGHTDGDSDHAGDGKGHAYRVHFEGGEADSWSGTLKQPHYENHFIGDDPARWGTGCGVFGEVLLKDVWPGIDLMISGKDGIKYDLIAAPGVDPSLIRFRYEGQSGLALKNGDIHVQLRTGEIIEHAPVSFASSSSPFGDAGPMREVASRYVLNGPVMSFDVPRHAGQTLIIDPVLTFASYTGSTADNFGCTATYDQAGHLYGGGIVFNVGYPVTLGVLQDFWAGGTVDVGLSKWTADGTNLVWSTYLGGAQGADAPHSLVVNDQEELFVMGTTGSSDYPTTAGCYDASFGAGSSISWLTVSFGYGYSHPNGTDVFVAHFNANATALLGSTYVGGDGADGLNNNTALTHNYGDHFRGEITLDANQNPIVATATTSAGLFTSPGAPQPAISSGQDGYVFRMNSALTNMTWATYIGGTGNDSAYGVQFDSNGNLFVAGGTTSTNLNIPAGSADNSANGGTDGFIMKYNGTTGALMAGCYVGTSAYDQCYLVQVDTNDEVYVAGQTHGAYPVTPGKYSNAGSSQFIHKFSNTLGASQWSTVIGNGSIAQDMSPTAFLVSDCGQIFFTGWAGTVNNNAGNSSSTCTGSPVTPGAFQSTTTGSDFYLMVLEPQATALNYATFFGGPSSAEHVDGGTSRFDKNGTVYHAVCAGCGSQDDFPTTPGAWSNTNNSFNCNLGVFKFDLSPTQAFIGIDGPSTICVNGTAQFTNSSVGGSSYEWDFDDGSPVSTDFEPDHVFSTPGEFVVTMVLTDASGCLDPDTASLVITVSPGPIAQADPVDPVCPGGDAQLSASGGTQFAWSPSLGLNSTTVADPIASPAQTTVYSVVVSDACGSDTADVTVTVIVPQTTLTPDTSVCLGGSLVLLASGGDQYQWSPTTTLDDPSSAAPTATPDTTTTYSVSIITPDGCEVIDSVQVMVFDAPPVPQLQDTIICFGTSIQLHATPADLYDWHPANGIAMLHVQSPVVSPTVPTLYIVDLVNACGALTDSAFVDLIYVHASAWPDTIVCPGIPVQLGAAGGIGYQWSPANGLSNDTIADPVAMPSTSTSYSVIVSDVIGCTDTAVVQIDLHPLPVIIAGPDLLIEYGDPAQLTATGDGTWTWSPLEEPADSLNGSPIVHPEETTSYTVTTIDALGCKNTDVLVVVVQGSLYLPNTFTPNGDSFNDTFGALGKEIADFELMVFNRWGELIWTTNQLNGRWDGTYQGVESPIDTYVWRVKATEHSGRFHEAIGHVNLVR